jgi:Na+/proline symporter
MPRNGLRRAVGAVRWYVRELIDEWGLGGRSFGTWVTWFLLGGDLYTAYTFVAAPVAIYAADAGDPGVKGELPAATAGAGH